MLFPFMRGSGMINDTTGLLLSICYYVVEKSFSKRTPKFDKSGGEVRGRGIGGGGVTVC